MYLLFFSADVFGIPAAGEQDFAIANAGLNSHQFER
jgi:hypothetical protein